MINKYIGKEEIAKLLLKLNKRAEEDTTEIDQRVSEILKNVKSNGNKALMDYSKSFDNFDVEDGKDFLVSEAERKAALDNLDIKLKEALIKARKNIEAYHSKQIRGSWMMDGEFGSIMGQRVLPLERVGVYVPGGTAAYPSSVLMNVIPAKLAGVKEVIMVTPPSCPEVIIAAAELAGVDKIFKVGGAQAIGALAYGTETIPKVDKIVGPGNIYVTLAKKQCFGIVDIDMIAGPSEILIIADEKANPAFIAADLMSQAEHDVLASSILITTSDSLAEQVKDQIDIQIKKLSRSTIIEKSLTNYGAILLVDTLKEAIEISNTIAPEHLELMVQEPINLLPEIKNAGSVFLGAYSPEPLGDYMGGPNHVLPTNGTARFFSPLSVDDFVKKSSFIYYTKEGLSKLREPIMTIANSEGLSAHSNSIDVRFKDGKII